jgi:hypothetical protein
MDIRFHFALPPPVRERVAHRKAACRDRVRESGKYRFQEPFQGYRDTAAVTQPFLIPEPGDAKPLMLAPSRGMQTRYGPIGTAARS